MSYFDKLYPWLKEANSSCKQCGQCCKDAVVISTIEAISLIGRPIINEGIGCPFLGKKGGGYFCSVYDVRPSICAFYGYRKPEGKYLGYGIKGAEIISFGYCDKMDRRIVDKDITAVAVPLGINIGAFGMTMLVHPQIRESELLYFSPIQYSIADLDGKAILAPNKFFSQAAFDQFAKMMSDQSKSDPR